MNRRKTITKCLLLIVTISLKEIQLVQTSTNNTVHGTDEQSLHSSTSSNHFAGDNLTTYKPADRTTNGENDEHNVTAGSQTEKHTPSFGDAKVLHAKLMKDYNKYIRPVKNQTKPVKVYLAFAIYSLQDLNELLERISVGGVFHLIWNDINMRWNKTIHGAVEHIFVGYKDVWLPEIILSNPSEKLHSFGQDWQLIRFDSNGWATWAPGDIITAKCNLNHRYFPFDTQTCSLDLHVWAYLATEVKLIPIIDKIDTSLMPGDSSWRVVKTSAVAWGDDWVSSVTYTIHMTRKPQNVIINALLPILFLCLLNVLVFILPAESGERVSFAITVLLSIAVFMTIVANTLPKSSDPMPLVAYFLVAVLAMSSVVCVCTIWNLRLFYRNDGNPVPNWLKTIYSCSSRFCGLDRQGSGKSREEPAGSTINNNKRGSLRTETNDVEMIEFPRSAKIITTAAVRWQDMSRMLDIFFLVLFTLFSFASFVTFFAITNIQ